MAVKVQIDVTIDENGEIKMKTHGFKGKTCIEELKSFEKALGPMSDVKKSSEFYEKETSKSKVGSQTK